MKVPICCNILSCSLSEYNSTAKTLEKDSKAAERKRQQSIQDNPLTPTPSASSTFVNLLAGSSKEFDVAENSREFHLCNPTAKS